MRLKLSYQFQYPFSVIFTLMRTVFFLITCLLGVTTLHAQTNLETGGRVAPLSDKGIRLIGAASFVAFEFEGTDCQLTLASVDDYPHHNYVSLELDGTYLGRIRIEPGRPAPYSVAVTKSGRHRLVVYKATEAQNGFVDFLGTTAKIVAPGKAKKRKRIEFIGDSITCGMGNDESALPCGSGEWYDQHNAYWSYAPITARALHADFLLSSVSGMGMYRNWNTENSESEIMPEVYGKLALRESDTRPFDATFQPDVVTICLGTNDLSAGDGKKPRTPFDAKQFTDNYIAFIKMLQQRYPKAQIVLLSSPMLNGERHATLMAALDTIQAAFPTGTLRRFTFQPMEPKGCGYHPSKEDDQKMASELTPFLKKLLDEK
ncbi:SGNH/GDSL hydrolase family protein [Flavobacterium sp. HJ-32-4]|uniref:SGNH/GDSL hydrolase family protein n=2 Tax=unclassified Flavobacterium TaxID=196869 RepID=UPI001F13B067|nr:SGNH/GDSL hydrolase family protein [Flavobacterium sp. HJ-32-4]UMY65398.1 GDSL-type esterase/lipase family protein [Flavobacterium sp. HJ-32-4]